MVKLKGISRWITPVIIAGIVVLVYGSLLNNKSIVKENQAINYENQLQALALDKENLAKSNRSYIRGIEAMSKGDYEAAMVYFADVIPGDPDYPEASQKIQVARTEFEKKVLAGSRTHIKEGDFESAIRLLERLLAIDPDSAEARTLKQEAEAKFLELSNKATKESTQKVPADLKNMKQTMGRWEPGTGTFNIAVEKTKVSSVVTTDYNFHYDAQDHPDSRFVWLHIIVANKGKESVRLKPGDFFLATNDGYKSTCDQATFSQDHLKDMELEPGQSTKGWLIFFMPKGNSYTLYYYGAGGGLQKDIFL